MRMKHIYYAFYWKTETHCAFGSEQMPQQMPASCIIRSNSLRQQEILLSRAEQVQCVERDGEREEVPVQSCHAALLLLKPKALDKQFSMCRSLLLVPPEVAWHFADISLPTVYPCHCKRALWWQPACRLEQCFSMGTALAFWGQLGTDKLHRLYTSSSALGSTWSKAPAAKSTASASTATIILSSACSQPWM